LINLAPEEWEQYCPVCSRVITANNIDEVLDGRHNGYVFVHDDIVHDDDDMEALYKGIH